MALAKMPAVPLVSCFIEFAGERACLFTEGWIEAGISVLEAPT